MIAVMTGIKSIVAGDNLSLDKFPYFVKFPHFSFQLSVFS